MEDMIARAGEREINIKHLWKRKEEVGQVSEVLEKKPKGFDFRSKG